jgi:hypothetical protein
MSYISTDTYHYQYSVLSTQYSVLSTQYSVLSTKDKTSTEMDCSVLILPQKLS